jgi:hypothetical protein
MITMVTFQTWLSAEGERLGWDDDKVKHIWQT